MVRPAQHDRKVFFPTVHVPRVALLLEFVLLAFMAAVLTASLPIVLHWLSLIVSLGATAGLIWWQDRTMCFPRLEFAGTELRYRDANGAKTVSVADVRTVSGGTRLAVHLADGSVVDFPAIAATQLELARGRDTYPDRAARELTALMAAKGLEPPKIAGTTVAPDRRRAAVIAMISMSVVWTAIIIAELLRR